MASGISELIKKLEDILRDATELEKEQKEKEKKILVEDEPSPKK